jgi:hypothetical protein
MFNIPYASHCWSRLSDILQIVLSGMVYSTHVMFSSGACRFLSVGPQKMTLGEPAAACPCCCSTVLLKSLHCETQVLGATELLTVISKGPC